MFIKEQDTQDQEQEDKEFKLSAVIFGTLYKNFYDKKNGYKLKLLNLAKQKPALAAEISASIKATEDLLKKYREALENWQGAAKDAKERYDQTGSMTGKVKKFFGFEPGKPKDKIFGEYDLTDKKFKNGNLYTIRDILSMDFNIGLTAEPETIEKDLKKEVQEMVEFVKYLKTKKKGSAAGDDEETLQEKIKKLEYVDSFEFFTNLLGLKQSTTESLLEGNKNPFNTAPTSLNKLTEFSKKLFEEAKKDIVYLDKPNRKDVLQKIVDLIFKNSYFIIFFLQEGGDKTFKEFHKECFKASDNLDVNGKNNLNFLIDFTKMYLSEDFKMSFSKKTKRQELKDDLRGTEPEEPEEEEEEEDPKSDIEKKVEETLKKLQEISPVFDDQDGKMKFLYSDPKSPWGKWAEKHKMILGMLSDFVKQGFASNPHEEYMDKLDSLPDLKIDHVKAQLKAYAEHTNNEGLLGTFNREINNPNKLLRLHKDNYNEIADVIVADDLDYSEQEEDGEIPGPEDFTIVYTNREGQQWAEELIYGQNDPLKDSGYNEEEKEYRLSFANMMYSEGEWQEEARDITTAIDVSLLKNLSPSEPPKRISKLTINNAQDGFEYELFYDPNGNKEYEIKEKNEKENMERFLEKSRQKYASYLPTFKNKIGATFEDIITLKAFNIVYKTKDNKFKPLKGLKFQEPKTGDFLKSLGIHHEDLTDESILYEEDKNNTILVAFMQENSDGEEKVGMMAVERFNNYITQFHKPLQQTQERLIKLIKPLIREKLKRKQNGKKNLRN